MICRCSPLLAVGVDDRVERYMRVGGFDVVGQLDVAELGAANCALLLLDRERVPGLEVVQVLLHDDVAATGELGVLLADRDRGDCRRAVWVFGPIDEAEQVALVKRPEAVNLVDDLRMPR
jgi:hypothetical protein